MPFDMQPPEPERSRRRAPRRGRPDHLAFDEDGNVVNHPPQPVFDRFGRRISGSRQPLFYEDGSDIPQGYFLGVIPFYPGPFADDGTPEDRRRKERRALLYAIPLALGAKAWLLKDAIASLFGY